jgi:type IV pilus assembly protein PilN
MPRINLLPWREQQRTERKKSFAVGMIAAFIAALAVTGAGYLFMNAVVDAQTSRNQRLTEEIKVLDKKIEEINSLEQQKQQHIARMQIIDKLQRSRSEIVHVFDTFVKIVPDGTYLTSVVQNGQRFKIQGVAQSATRVSSFMKAIEASEWLKLGEDSLDQVTSLPNSPLSSSFSLEAVQVSQSSNAPAAPAKKKAGAK